VFVALFIDCLDGSDEVQDMGGPSEVLPHQLVTENEDGKKISRL